MTTSAAATWNILCDQGKTLERSFRYGTRCSDGTFVPFDNTGWSARMTWRKTYTSGADLEVDSAGGEIVLGGANGEISFTIPASVMEDLLGKYVYDLELFQGSPEVVVSPVRGQVTVRQEVTT